MRLLKLLSIRSLLVLVVLLSTFPLLMLVLWTNRNVERQALNLLSHNAMETARSFTASQQLVDAFLVSMADLFSSDLTQRGPRSADASALFRREAGRMDMLEDILLVNASGDVLASLSDRFEDGMWKFKLPDEAASEDLYVGDILFIEDTDGKQTACLPFMRFFETESTPPSRYGIIMLLKTAYLENLAEKLELSKGWSLQLLDVSGKDLLSHLPGTASADVPFSMWTHIQTNEDSGSFIAPDSRHAFGYSRVRFTPDSSPYAVTVVSIPTKDFVGAGNVFFFHRTLLLTAVFTFLGILLALGVGRMLLLVPIDRLVQAHRRFARGDSTSRADIRDGIREMMVLSKAFNDMATILEVQDMRRRSETEQMKEQAHRDYLTGTWNRRAGLLALDRLMAESHEHSTLLALFFIDIDFFKQINDEHGHNEGDRMLRRVTLILERHLRTRDILCRYGGDEFMVILPGCTWQAAEEVWRRIEKEIHRINDEGGVPYVLSLSHGMAVFDPTVPVPPTSEQLIALADARMYEEKATHRESRQM